MKAGFCGEDHPCIVRENGVILDKKESNTTRSVLETTYDETPSDLKYKVGTIESEDLIRPIVRGSIDNWDAMQTMWDHLLMKDLQVELESTSVCLTDNPGIKHDKVSERNKMAEYFFEHISAPSFYVAPKPVVSLFSTGRTRGLVVAVGGGVTNITPVFEGFAISHASQFVEFAGSDLTSYLAKLIDVELSKSTLQDIKETMCSVSTVQSFTNRNSKLPGQFQLHRRKTIGESNEMEKESSTSFELPDGTLVEIPKSCMHGVPEALFDSSVGLVKTGLSILTVQSLDACDKTLQHDLVREIVIAGGSSMFNGFASRLETELSTFLPDYTPKVIQDSQRKYASWIGASMLASLNTFSQISISKAEYEEDGERIIARKCI